MLKSIASEDFSGKRILVRVDFNVEFSDIVNIQEHFRLDIVKETIDVLASFPGSKVAIVTHLGRPEGKVDPRYSVARMVPAIGRALGKKVVFVPDCLGETVATALDNLAAGEVLLMENIRFYPGEERNDQGFARQLAMPFDCFVNEAFSVCHRAHASLEAITRFLPAFAGLRLLKEVAKLDEVRFSPQHPAIAIIGGAKIETKLPLIKALEENYDCILVGGKVANEALDQKIVFSPKVLLPQDFDSALRLDIGPQTIAYYTQIIKTAKTIIWNGPMGKFEEKPYDIGTDAILHALLQSKAYVVIGGGESLAVLENANALGKVSFVSSGGGAMLEYLSGLKLPGLVVLEA